MTLVVKEPFNTRGSRYRRGAEVHADADVHPYSIAGLLASGMLIDTAAAAPPVPISQRTLSVDAEIRFSEVPAGITDTGWHPAPPQSKSAPKKSWLPKRK